MHHLLDALGERNDIRLIGPNDAALRAPTVALDLRRPAEPVAAALAGVYAKAPEIAKAVPQADPAVSSYVALVDQARLWLDAQVRSVMGAPPL